MKAEIYIPREDSYFLTQFLKEYVQKLPNKDSTFLEIGSGSGIQLQTLLDSGIKKQNIFSCDLNPEAAEHCKNLGFNCVQSDLFQNIKGKYNFIIFNSPYLLQDHLEPESSRISTTGGKKGNEIINGFLKQAKSHLNENGKIFILTSSLSGEINFLNYKKKELERKKLFFEELIVWKLEITTK